MLKKQPDDAGMPIGSSEVKRSRSYKTDTEVVSELFSSMPRGRYIDVLTRRRDRNDEWRTTVPDDPMIVPPSVFLSVYLLGSL